MNLAPTFRSLARQFRRLLPSPNAKGTVWIGYGDMRRAKSSTAFFDTPDSLDRALDALSKDFVKLYTQKKPPNFPSIKSAAEARRFVAERWPTRLAYPKVELVPDLNAIRKSLGRKPSEEAVRTTYLNQLAYSEPPSGIPIVSPYIENMANVCNVLAEAIAEPEESPAGLLREDPLRMSTRQRLILHALRSAKGRRIDRIADLPERMESEAKRLGLDFTAGDDTELRESDLPLLGSCEWINKLGKRKGVSITDEGLAALGAIERHEKEETLNQELSRNQPAPLNPLTPRI